MAKAMARIEGSVVVNMEWHNSEELATETLVDPGDRPVCIGDTYSDGRWFRDGEEILTPLEQRVKELEEQNASMRARLADAAAALEHLEVSDT